VRVAWHHQDYRPSTTCVCCGELAYCSGPTRATVRCEPCYEGRVPVAPSLELEEALEQAAIEWVQGGPMPKPAETNREVLARIEAQKEARREAKGLRTRAEYPPQRGDQGA
jgi:hypothetical protein